MKQPVKVYGLAILTLPVGFFTAITKEQQIDALYEIADSPGTLPMKSARLARYAGKLLMEGV